MPPNDSDKSRIELTIEQREVERMMYQIIQSSISLIGFGFTIHAFLDNANASSAFSIDLDQAARRIGLAMITLGLWNLAVGATNQSRYLRALQRRYAVAPDPEARPYSPRPTFVVAWLLLGIGVTAFASMLVQMLP